MASYTGEQVGYTAALAGATGIYKGLHYLLPKAQLYVPKVKDSGAADAMNAMVGNKDSMALKALVAAKAKNAKTGVASEGLKGKLKQAAGALPVVSLVSAATLKSATASAAFSADNYSMMTVQYNPKSIQISANGGGMLRPPAGGDAGSTQVQISSNVMRTNFSVELVFEDINVADAFHLEGLSMNAEELTKTAASAVFNSIGDGYSVQKQCDGLLSLLNFKRLKQVIFVWSDMFFHGELTNVDVRYEMFNKLGNPILAKVRLSIQQNDSTKTIKYVSDDGQWNTAFNIAFSESKTKMGKYGF